MQYYCLKQLFPVNSITESIRAGTMFTSISANSNSLLAAEDSIAFSFTLSSLLWSLCQYL